MNRVCGRRERFQRVFAEGNKTVLGDREGPRPGNTNYRQAAFAQRGCNRGNRVVEHRFRLAARMKTVQFSCCTILSVGSSRTGSGHRALPATGAPFRSFSSAGNAAAQGRRLQEAGGSARQFGQNVPTDPAWDSRRASTPPPAPARSTRLTGFVPARSLVLINLSRPENQAAHLLGRLKR